MRDSTLKCSVKLYVKDTPYYLSTISGSRKVRESNFQKETDHQFYPIHLLGLEVVLLYDQEYNTAVVNELNTSFDCKYLY